MIQIDVLFYVLFLHLVAILKSKSLAHKLMSENSECYVSTVLS